MDEDQAIIFSEKIRMARVVGDPNKKNVLLEGVLQKKNIKINMKSLLISAFLNFLPLPAFSFQEQPGLSH